MRLLRTPWLAALLLLASPAMAGVVLPALHPCPVQTATSDGSSGHQHGHSGHDESGQPTCTCVGSCHVPALVDAPQPLGAIRAQHNRVAPLPAVSPETASTGVLLPLDYLPPITAPPLS